MTIRLGIVGASGRLGRTAAALALQNPLFRLEAALTHEGSSSLGKDVGLLLGKEKMGLYFSCDLLEKEVDVYLDVSLPVNFQKRIETLLSRKKPIVIGSTGLSKEDLAFLQKASLLAPIFYAPNFSLGLWILRKLASDAASSFSLEASIDLLEKHHAEKKDAPSGSAKLLAEAIEKEHPKRKRPSIESIRFGSIIGEHEVAFRTEEETLTLSHKAESRELFAKGALKAVQFLAEKGAGLYGMQDLMVNAYNSFQV